MSSGGVVANFHVSPEELTGMAGRIQPCGEDVVSAGQALGGDVSGTVGLPDLDGVLDDLSSALSAWLAQAGTDLVTLSYDTEAAGLAYATVEKNNTNSMGGGGGPSGPGNPLVA